MIFPYWLELYYTIWLAGIVPAIVIGVLVARHEKIRTTLGKCIGVGCVWPAVLLMCIILKSYEWLDNKAMGRG